MSSIIQLLPDHVANQIAAGEVVQRPASVVKELLENAVDAQSSSISLIIKEAGKTLIQVIDNGVGMNVTDARMCFERHATSKIRLAEDLFALNTKGFRGEALASIAAIAHVEMKTKQTNEKLGTHIVIEGSKFISQEPAVLANGTSFLVKNLFFNIPARRNFLKSDIVEFRHIIDEFQRLVLAHPNIQFSLYHNGSEMFNLPATSLRQRIVNLMSGKTNEKLVPVNENTDIVKIRGFVSKPEFAKKSRGEQFFFVNDRFIKSPYLNHAIQAAYDGILKQGLQPSYYLYLTVPTESIDINIHPTKTEIKFDNEQSLYAIIRAAVKHSLGQFNIAPILDFERDATLDSPYRPNIAEFELPKIAVDRNFNPFTNDIAPKKNDSVSTFDNKFKPQWESLYLGMNDFKDQATQAQHSFESDVTTTALFDDAAFETANKQTYQIHKKYIVSPIKSGMVIIDQQRAHQRILYESFLTNMTLHQAVSQQLLFPIEMSFTKSELSLINQLLPALEQMGFGIAIVENEKIVISGIPSLVSDAEVGFIIEQLIQEMTDETQESCFSQSDRIAKSMAKSLAIKTGTNLTLTEQENIVNSLFACKEPNISPFQKSTFITLKVDDIDKKFTS
jgi:DNA mismatch repair protein MutL